MLCQVAFARDLNVLSLGDEKALHLGLDTKVSRAILFIIASLITGACVAVSGVIGFVGLIVPHVMRKAIGTDHHVLLPAAMLAGANLLILSDTLAQVLIRPLELPVGVITGILGGAFFLIMLLEEGEVVER
jgi:iron complex transport system permease protein